MYGWKTSTSGKGLFLIIHHWLCGGMRKIVCTVIQDKQNGTLSLKNVSHYRLSMKLANCTVYSVIQNQYGVLACMSSEQISAHTCATVTVDISV